MNPLLVIEAASTSATPASAPVMPEVNKPVDALAFSTLLEGVEDVVPASVAPEIIAGAAEAEAEVPPAGLPDGKLPQTEQEAALVQLVPPENAKSAGTSAADQVIEIRNSRAVTALTEGKNAKVLLESNPQESRASQASDRPSTPIVLAPASAVSAQSIMAARGLSLPITKDVPVLDSTAPDRRADQPPKGITETTIGLRSAVVAVPPDISQRQPGPAVAVSNTAGPTPNPKAEKDIEAKPNLRNSEVKTPSANAQPPVLPAAATLQTGMISPKAFMRTVEDADQSSQRALPELGPLASSEIRPSPNAPTTIASPTPTAEAARQVAHQLSAAISAAQGRATEIALNPEELGRVKMTLSASEGTVMLVLLADRPETTELMRRHIDVLAEQFRAIGYNDISFSFGSDGQSDNPKKQELVSVGDEKAGSQIDQQDATPAMTRTGLDLRV